MLKVSKKLNSAIIVAGERFGSSKEELQFIKSDMDFVRELNASDEFIAEAIGRMLNGNYGLYLCFTIQGICCSVRELKKSVINN